MTTSIFITGQISGNFKLLNAIYTYESEKRGIGFNNYQLIFKTKKEAKKALWDGFNYLKRNEPDFVRHDDYSAKHGTISYDASRAEIK